MRISLQTAFTCFLMAFLSVACSKRESLSPGAPKWLLTYDEVGTLHQQITNEFRKDSTLFNESERESYHEMQKRWTDLITIRSDMMKTPGAGSELMSSKVMNTSSSNENPNVRPATIRSDGDSLLSKFRKGVQELLGSYESLAYLMKGIPGRAEIDTTVQRTIRKQRILIRQVSNDTTSSTDLAELISPEEIVSMYNENCSDCHGIHGEGSSDVYPPLDRNSVAAKDKVALIKLVLQGLDGTVVVGGRRYDGAMPSFRASLSDPQIAAILRYVRKMARASDITVKTSEVKRLAEETASRTEPFSPGELNLNR